MSVIVFSSNPSDWAALDGVYINEVSPPGRVTGINSGIVGLVGEFERYVADPLTGNPLVVAVGSAQELADKFGGRGAGGMAYPGALGMQGRRFGPMRISPVVTAGRSAASFPVKDSTGLTVFSLNANSRGAWGNGLSANVGPGSNPNSLKVVITYAPASPGISSDRETFDNLPIQPPSQAALNGALRGAVSTGVGASKYVNFIWVAPGGGTVPAQQGPLTGGGDGVPSAADYLLALSAFETLAQQDVMIVAAANPPDALRVAVNAGLAAHAAAYPGQLVVVAGQSTDTVAAAVAAKQVLGQLQNLIYTFNHPWVTLPEGLQVQTGPETFMAAIRSQQLPELSAADPDTAPMLQAISSLTLPALQRSDYIALKAAGIAGIAPYDADRGGYTFYSSVNTYYPAAQAKGTDEGMIERRHLASYIELSIARRLKAYQSKPLPLNPDGSLSPDHLQVLGEATTFLAGLQKDLRIGGFALDPLSGNTPAGLAGGQFILISKVLRNPNADAIVLRSQVGSTVQLAS